MKALLASLVLVIATAVGAMAAPVLSVTSPTGQTDFEFKDLDALDQTEVVTSNDYVEGKHSFSGPLLREIFGAAAPKMGESIKLTALNDYAVTIPADDALKYDVILATTVDGKRMSVRDKGPIWVIYPMDDFPELRAPVYNDRLIWQLSKVELVPAK